MTTILRTTTGAGQKIRRAARGALCPWCPKSSGQKLPQPLGSLDCARTLALWTCYRATFGKKPKLQFLDFVEGIKDPGPELSLETDGDSCSSREDSKASDAEEVGSGQEVLRQDEADGEDKASP